jgi:hypothetical protein
MTDSFSFWWLYFNFPGNLIRNRIQNKGTSKSNLLRVSEIELDRLLYVADREDEKSERLIHNYIVIFGLIVAYGQDHDL